MVTLNRNVRREAGEQGYALMLVVFLCAMILVAAMAAAPNILTEGRREKEREMIWRGGQYVRAISLYRRKTTKFPPSLEELAKGQPGIHFLRKQYKDPFNTEDGSWRLIYAGPSGQLIGSFTQTWNANQVIPTPPARGTAAPSSSAPPATGEPTSQSQTDGGAGAASAATAPVPDASAINSSPVFGGSLVRVGSKIDHSSIIRFRKAKNYRLFEFIWDPMKELNAGLPSTGPAPGRPGDPLTPSAQPDPILNPKQP